MFWGYVRDLFGRKVWGNCGRVFEDVFGDIAGMFWGGFLDALWNVFGRFLEGNIFIISILAEQS